MADTSTAVEASTDIYYQAKKGLQAYWEGLDTTAKEVNDLKDELDDLRLFIDGPVGQNFEDFTQQQIDLQTEMDNVKKEIQTAITEGYDPMGEKVSGLKGKYDELKTQYDENAIMHENATQRIIFDLALQRAAVDGVSEEEYEVLTNLAYGWGLIDLATLKTAEGIDEAFRDLADGASITDVMNQLFGIAIAAETAETVGAQSALDLAKSAGMQALKAEASEIAGRVWSISAGLDAIDGRVVTAHVDVIYQKGDN